MKTSESLDKLAVALSKAQGEMKNPEKNRTATIPTKSGGVYSYNYADLPSTLDGMRDVLSKNGLSHISGPEDTENGLVLKMRLLHTSGQWIEAECPLSNKADIKLLGAEFTYARRYLFNALTGIAADDDLDGEPEHQNAGYGNRKPEANIDTSKIPLPRKLTQAQIARLYAIAKSKGYLSADAVKTFVKSMYPNVSISDLSQKEYELVCSALQKSTPPGAAIPQLQQFQKESNWDESEDDVP